MIDVDVDADLKPKLGQNIRLRVATRTGEGISYLLFGRSGIMS